MRELVEALCSERCAGRAAGSPGGAAARAIVVDALRRAGLDPREQPVPACGGANVLAALPGEIDRWIVVGAHYDHLGTRGRDVFHGADDNAAAVAVLVEVAAGLARKRAAGRGVVIAAFDGEEPPHFGTEAMGSEAYARSPLAPLDRTDLMICMDLVGHAVGPEGLPDPVRQTVFALGAERSEGTGALVDGLAASVPGVIVRRTDAEVIPPLSDYDPFWRREIPFLFLTCGRWRHYHTPADTPEKLDYDKIASTARWLEEATRAACALPDRPGRFLAGARDDGSTIRSLLAITESIADVAEQARHAHALASDLLGACDPTGRLAEARRPELAMLVEMLESGLA